MKIIDALEKLEAQFPAQIVAAQYSIHTTVTGIRWQRCGLYFKGTYVEGDTWEEAFLKIDGKPDISEPEIEDSMFYGGKG